MKHFEFTWTPPADRNVAILAFNGWSDAGSAATSAIERLAEHTGAREFAALDPDAFYDFQVTRPEIHVTDGIIEDLAWPQNTLSYAGAEGLGAKMHAGYVFGNMHEPNLYWRDYVAAICDLIDTLAIRRIFTLGSLLSDVPHTRPATIVGTATSAELRDRLGIDGADYEGPTGIVGVLQHEFAKRGIEAASMWASVPHYVSMSPNPKGILALLDAIAPLLGLDETIDLDDLRAEAAEFESEVDEAIQDNPEISAYVDMLEDRSDTQEPAPLVESQMPSGDELASEVQAFLRLHDDD